MIVRPNPLEQLAGGDRHRNYSGPRDFLEDFLEGEGAPTSSLLRWNLKIQPGKPKPQSGQFLKFRNFQLRVIPKIPRIFRQKVLKFQEFSGSPCKALTSSQMDRKRRRGIRQGGRRAKIGVEPVAFYGDIPLQGPHKQPNGPEEEAGHPTGRPQSENRGRARSLLWGYFLQIYSSDR